MPVHVVFSEKSSNGSGLTITAREGGCWIGLGTIMQQWVGGTIIQQCGGGEEWGPFGWVWYHHAAMGQGGTIIPQWGWTIIHTRREGHLFVKEVKIQLRRRFLAI